MKYNALIANRALVYLASFDRARVLELAVGGYAPSRNTNVGQSAIMELAFLELRVVDLRVIYFAANYLISVGIGLFCGSAHGGQARSIGVELSGRKDESSRHRPFSIDDTNTERKFKTLAAHFERF